MKKHFARLSLRCKDRLVFVIRKKLKRASFMECLLWTVNDVPFMGSSDPVASWEIGMCYCHLISLKGSLWFRVEVTQSHKGNKLEGRNSGPHLTWEPIVPTHPYCATLTLCSKTL